MALQFSLRLAVYTECLGLCYDASLGHVSVVTAWTPPPWCLPVHTNQAQATLLVPKECNLLQGLLPSLAGTWWAVNCTSAIKWTFTLDSTAAYSVHERGYDPFWNMNFRDLLWDFLKTSCSTKVEGQNQWVSYKSVPKKWAVDAWVRLDWCRKFSRELFSQRRKPQCSHSVVVLAEGAHSLPQRLVPSLGVCWAAGSCLKGLQSSCSSLNILAINVLVLGGVCFVLI